MTGGSSGSVAPPGPPGPAAARPPRPLVFSITLTGIMANTLIAPALPDIVRDLGVGSGAAGLLMAAATLPGIVMAPLIGLFADRYGRRAILVPCLVVFGVSGLLAAAAPTFPLLLLCRFLQGVGSAGLINLAVVIIGDHWDGTERAAVIGQNSALLTSSIAVLPPLGGVLTDAFGWRATFLPYGLALATAYVIARHLPRGTRREVSIGEQVGEAIGFLRTPTVMRASVLGIVVFILIFGLFLTAMPLYVEDRFGIGAGGRGVILGIPAITSTLAALSLGRLQARFGGARLVLAASVLFTIAFATIAGAPSLGVLVIGTLVYGFGEGVTIPTLQNVVASAAPASSRGSVVAVWVGGVRSGQTAGPLLAGAGVAAYGAPETFAIGAGVALALVVIQLVLRAGDAREGRTSGRA